MICERCRGRFGTLGATYWNVKSGTCPVCQEGKNLAYLFPSSHPAKGKQ